VLGLSGRGGVHWGLARFNCPTTEGGDRSATSSEKARPQGICDVDGHGVEPRSFGRERGGRGDLYFKERRGKETGKVGQSSRHSRT